MNRTLKKQGFSFVELLVVLAALAILASVLLPVFVRVRERGRLATCTSNLKQLALATQQYVQDNDGIYPVAVDIVPDGPVIWWHQRLQPYLPYGPVYYCPTLTSLRPHTAINYTYNRYGINAVSPIVEGQHVIDAGKHEAAIEFAEKTFLNTEVVGLPLDPDLAVAIPSPCGQRTAYVSIVHSGGGNFSFVDGHVKWLALRDAAQFECDRMPLHERLPL